MHSSWLDVSFQEFQNGYAFHVWNGVFHVWNGVTEELVFIGGTLTDHEAVRAVRGWRTFTDRVN